jgi:hypothetical protein
LRLARRIFAAPALKKFVREESLPGMQVPDQRRTARLRAAQRRQLATCTCIMVKQAMAVADDELRAHCIEGSASSTPR